MQSVCILVLQPSFNVFSLEFSIEMTFKRLCTAETPGISWIKVRIHQYSCSQTIFGLLSLKMVAVGVAGFLALGIARFRLGVRRLGVNVGLSSDSSLIYFHLSSLPIRSRGILYSFKALASCFQPAGAGVVVRLRKRSLTRSTMCVFGKVVFFSTSSLLSLHDTFGLLLRCFKRRVACVFLLLGNVSNTKVSTSSEVSIGADSNLVYTLGLSIFKYLFRLFE